MAYSVDGVTLKVPTRSPHLLAIDLRAEVFGRRAEAFIFGLELKDGLGRSVAGNGPFQSVRIARIEQGMRFGRS